MQTVDQRSSCENSSTSHTSQLAAFIGQVQIIGTALAVAVDHFAARILPTARALHDFCERSDVQAGLRKAEAALRTMHGRVQAFDAPGHTPYFEHMGYDGIEARLHAAIVRDAAKRFYKESQNKRIALVALRDLAKRPRWHPALVRQVSRLRDHWGTARFLDEAFDKAGCPALKQEMLDLLETTREDNFSCGPRLIAIAAQVAPHAPSSRGRPVRYETVLHQTFLRWSGEFGGRQGYTYGLMRDGEADDFVDEATAATRIELGRPSFNPVAARRAERQRLATKPKDEEAVTDAI